MCNELGVKKIVHISALGVKENHKSQYMHSKLQGEKNIQNIFKKSIILRPSVIFGPDDKFFNTFASLAQFSPAIPLIGGGKTKFAPIVRILGRQLLIMFVKYAISMKFGTKT